MSTSLAQKIRRVKLDSPRMERVLTQLQLARLANAEMCREGLSIKELAGRADLGESTVRRFIGMDGERSTIDPRSSTVRKIFEALGWHLTLVKQ